MLTRGDLTVSCVPRPLLGQGFLRISRSGLTRTNFPKKQLVPRLGSLPEPKWPGCAKDRESRNGRDWAGSTGTLGYGKWG